MIRRDTCNGTLNLSNALNQKPPLFLSRRTVSMRSLLHDLSEDILSSRSFESPPPLIGSGCPRIAIFVDSFLTLISLFWLFLIGRCEELEEQFDGRRATSNDCPLAACVVLDNQLLHRPRKVTPAVNTHRIEQIGFNIADCLYMAVMLILSLYQWFSTGISARPP
ncbi:hypothetical protein T4B_12794 [Trichinella pseudospiralis]|uniref:Uncharacterized protein n=1 Tax=Trichinella pseudospiralis TaxID=6337 RepID=A0A0V1F2B8_TRIPS|nr:hypothetical protein T4A_5081 [Trichinella pseudospiralis]KRZ20330.1 hypothetical protein T4B_12794 [Trichinella pseudospiralis]